METNHLYVRWTATIQSSPRNGLHVHRQCDAPRLVRAGHPDCMGATPKLACENRTIQAKIKEAREAGEHVTACKTSADQLGITKAHEELGIEVKYWKGPLTELLKKDEKRPTI